MLAESEIVKKRIRQFLADRKILHTENEYPDFSIFKITTPTGQGEIEIDLLGFEEEPQEPGDIFLNRPFYDPFFRAGGKQRLGQLNIHHPEFETLLANLLLSSQKPL